MNRVEMRFAVLEDDTGEQFDGVLIHDHDDERPLVFESEHLLLMARLREADAEAFEHVLETAALFLDRATLEGMLA